MKNKPNNSVFVNNILHISGLFLCIAPPAVCTLLYFPLWCEAGGEKVVAGGAALVLVLCAMPLVRFFKQHFKSPASYVMWLMAFLIFLLVSRVAHEMTVITFVGFVSNLLGAVLFGIAKRRRRENDE